MGARSSQSRGPGLNNTDGHLLEYYRNTFSGGGGGTNYVAPPPSGITATGGIISDYVESGPGDVYRAHVFTNSGTFDVSAIGDHGSNIEYLVVAGGGGGGGHTTAGGGGAGGVRTNLSGHPYATSVAFPVATNGGNGSGSYTVTIGAGGHGGFYHGYGSDGTDTSFGPPSTPEKIIANGGGGGAFDQGAGNAGGSGGGGGGSSGANYDGGASTQVNTPSPWPGPAVQGYAGGPNGPHTDGAPYTAGGGGGATAAGTAGNATNAGPGGAGVQVLIAGPSSTTGVGAFNPSNNQGQYFGGGGGGAPV